MSQSFTIDQVDWHTKTEGNPETRDQVVYRFFIVADFLQENGLTTRRLVNKKSDVGEHFSIKSDDLTPEGLSVLKSSYDKWLQKVDVGMDAADITLLTRALKRIRTAKV